MRSVRLDQWAQILSEQDIPVLRKTAHALDDARQQAGGLSVRQLSTLILNDPLMSVRILRFTTRHRARRQLQDIVTVEHAVMMVGVESFFEHFSEFDILEERLRLHPRALLGLLQVVRRAQRASRYALDWATWRCDLNAEELAVAALLHDLAEMLMWAFAPEPLLEVEAVMKANPGMRSAEAQRQVLGFEFNQLQTMLCAQWELPELLLSLMDDSHAERPRVKNVKLAVDLARHSAYGWDDPALPDDFTAISRLTNIDVETLRQRLGVGQKQA